MIQNTLVDFIPTEPKVIGFSNQWYPEAYKMAERIVIEDISIRLITAPYFLATKLVAFENRGNNDYLGSPDLEDIISILDGRPELLGELKKVNIKLKVFLTEKFQKLYNNPVFIEVLNAHLPGDKASQQRVVKLKQTIEKIISL